MASPSTISSPSETSSGVYGRIFWLAYLANSALVMANALTFRFAELVHYLGGSESAVGDIVALGTLIAVAVRLSVSHVLDDYGTRRLWPICSLLFMSNVSSHGVQGKSNPEKYLQNLYQLYSHTVKLNSELSLYNLGSDNLFLSKLTKVTEISCCK